MGKAGDRQPGRTTGSGPDPDPGRRASQGHKAGPEPAPGMSIWDLPERGTRGPRPRHDRAAISATAVRLADVEGLDALTMRRVAGALGMATMSLYNYVPAKDHLAQLMIDHVAGEYAYPSAPPADKRAAIADLAGQARDIARRHPWLAGLLRRPAPPGSGRAALPRLLPRAARGLQARHRGKAGGDRADQRLRHHVRGDAGRARR